MSGNLALVSVAFLALTQTTSSAPIGSSNTSTKLCVQLQILVPVVADQYHYDQPQVNSNIDAIDWTVNVTTWDMADWTARQRGTVHINQTFTISAQLCVPSKNTSKADILHIATAGQGFDRRYYDVEVQPEEYSYVDAAIGKGYSVLAYDRIGTGGSEKPDAYDVVQIPTDIEVLAGLTKIARSGDLISSSQVSAATTDGEPAIQDYQATKVVHVGHAYGSYIMSIMFENPTYGNLSDGALMTGLYFNFAMENNTLTVLNYNHAFPKESDPVRFAEWGSGYFVLDNKQTLQKLFFQKATLDPALLDYTESIKQPESVGTYSSEGNSTLTPATAFTGPIMFFTGEFDNYVCDGDCNGVYDEDFTNYLYPNAKAPAHYLQPGAGHATGLSTNASAGYEVMLQYLDSQGL
ncbi:hypothetical protein K491DRAFT_599447 [Lophiostoma macrostomum CBS 122681]|uniref:AB hydrolase-1 domain-containing protein n=1 Tax=Lophiostoma macrostomum CBS 122681 TaxID=1314788 RepID=A0A6A6T9D5_9PLEO|nr:hypothetical protein K491DRAFT_599447 [Lophiostoma macrostomum CBS 122681]